MEGWLAGRQSTGNFQNLLYIEIIDFCLRLPNVQWIFRLSPMFIGVRKCCIPYIPCRSLRLRWRVTGKAYVIKLKELRSVNKWFTQLSNHRYTRAVYFDSLEICNAAIDLASSSKYTIINGHNNRAQIE